MRPREQVKRDLVRQWLAKADQDFRAANALLETPSPCYYPACFHAQQSAEKCLKALLTWHQVAFPKTHALELLLELLRSVDDAIALMLDECVALTPYGVEVRYPGDQPEPGEEESRHAIALAQDVRNAILSALPDDLCEID